MSAQDNPGGFGYGDDGARLTKALEQVLQGVIANCTFESEGSKQLVVMGACVNILNGVVLACVPEGRDLVLRGLRASVDLIEVNARRTGH